MRGRDLVHPLPLGAVALLVVNDHLLKAAFPGAVTGKLSDLAGLFFFPILLVSVLRAPARRHVWLACAATALCFAAIKLEPHANALAAKLLGSCARDASDLIALPMTALAGLFLLRRERHEVGRLARTSAMVAASLASVATSRPRRPPCAVVPASEQHVSMDALCATTKGAVIVVNGATVAITIDLVPKSPGCVLGVLDLAIDQTVRPGLTARTRATAPSGAIEQTSRVTTRAELPYAARCEGLHLGLLYENAIVDLPIASCGVTP